MLPRIQHLASGPLVPSKALKSGIPLSGQLPYLRDEQFWGGLFGRPVILWIRGASYLW